DLVESSCDFRALHPHDRALQVHVFATSEIRVETCRHFNQRPRASVYVAMTLCGLEDSREQFENGRLARTVRSDDAERLSSGTFERDVTYPQESRVSELTDRTRAAQHSGDRRRNQVSQGIVSFSPPKPLPDAVKDNRYARHQYAPRPS